MLSRVRELVRALAGRFRTRRIEPTDPPVRFTDGEGREVLVRPYRDDDFESLAAMYDDFDPGQRAQGTPPVDPEGVRDWLGGVLDGVNAVALHDDAVVGHVTFVPGGDRGHELAIFVHQDYQAAGIGTNLLAAGLGHARREGVEYVWLSVEAWKRDAQRLYTRTGFTLDNPMGATQRMSRWL